MPYSSSIAASCVVEHFNGEPPDDMVSSRFSSSASVLVLLFMVTRVGLQKCSLFQSVLKSSCFNPDMSSVSFNIAWFPTALVTFIAACWKLLFSVAWWRFFRCARGVFYLLLPCGFRLSYCLSMVMYVFYLQYTLLWCFSRRFCVFFLLVLPFFLR